MPSHGFSSHSNYRRFNPQKPQAQDSGIEVVSKGEFEAVRGWLKSHSISGRAPGAVNADEIATIVGRQVKVSERGIRKILEAFGYHHSWDSHYSLDGPQQLNDLAYGAEKALGFTKPMVQKNEIQSLKVPMPKITIIPAPTEINALIEHHAKYGLPILIDPFAERFQIRADELQLKLEQMGWKPYLTPFQVNHLGWTSENSRDYRFNAA